MGACKLDQLLRGAIIVAGYACEAIINVAGEAGRLSIIVAG